MKTYFFLLILVFIAVSCKKEEEDTAVTATISITSPSANDTISYGQAVHLQGTINGSAEMHGYIITFTNQTTGNPIYSQVYDSHSNAYTINDSWTNNVSDTTTIKLLIDVEKDHDGNKETKELFVVCLPL
jgi:hypothetical protein